MAPKKYNQGISKSLEVKVIQSQHCIEVEGIQIELMYLFGQNTLHVYVEDRLVLSTQLRINQTQVNYANLIEVAVNYYQREVKRRIQELKEDYDNLHADNQITPPQPIHEYILKSITTITE